MDANNSSVTNLGVDPTGLKQEQTPDFLVLNHQQTLLQGLPLVQFADLATLKAEYDRAVREIAGQGLAVELR
jgi:hypothetical protein